MVVNNNESICPVCGEPTTKAITFCGNTMYIARQCSCIRKLKEQEATELKRIEQQEKYKEAILGIPVSYRAFTFERSLFPESKDYLVAREYVNNWTTNKAQGKGLMLMGKPRNGKTYLASAIGNAIAKDYQDSVFLDNYTSMIRKANNYNAVDALFDNIEKATLLIIDDLQMILPKDRRITYEIINRRYVTRKPLIITTNLNGTDIAGLIKEDLQNEQVFSRIHQMCEPVGISNPQLVKYIFGE